MCNFNEYIIDGNNLISNITKIKKYIGRQTKICAVVKADAYGVGVRNVCPIISDYVDYFAVVSVKEAMELRQITNTKPILILGAFNLNYIDWCSDNNVMVTISSLDEVKYINKYLNKTINVHIKINTGMNRYGIKTQSLLRQVIKEIKRGGKINIVGAYTHFATKANNLDFIDFQYAFFERMIKEIKEENLVVHCSNSYVSTTDKLKHCNMVRVGFSMYSAYYERLNIKDVVSIKSQVVFINKIRKGESVGYDRTHIAKRIEKIGVIPMGYADGFARNLSNNFKVLINGQFAPVVGNVCMDCFMVDLTNIKNVYVGSEVVLLGKSGENSIKLENYAKALNFSPYEVLTNFRTRRMNIKILNSHE